MNSNNLILLTKMGIVMVNPQVGVRLAKEQLDAIDVLIESGEFGNRAEFIQYAVRKMLKEFKGRAPSS